MYCRSVAKGLDYQRDIAWSQLVRSCPVHGALRMHCLCYSSQQQPCLATSAFTSRDRLQHTIRPHKTAICSVQAAAAQPALADPAASPQPNSQQQQWHQLVIDSAMDPSTLVKLVMRAKINLKDSAQVANVSNRASDGSGAAGSVTTAAAAGVMPYKQLTMRPVLLKGKLQLQLSLLDSRQDTTKNYSPEQAVQQLQQLLQLPWQSASLHTTQQTTHMQISRKGKILIQTSKHAAAAAAADQQGTAVQGGGLQPTQQQQLPSGSSSSSVGVLGPISLQHDRVKALPINGNIADPFLQKIGLQTADGRIKANMQAKFTQINAFLKLLIHTGELEHIGQQQRQQQQEAASTASSGGSSSSVHILDCGCGSSHLTFGTYHYLNNVKGLPIQLTGIDTNKALMDRSNKYCQDLGISDHARFHTAAIRQYQPQQQPDIVLALHACDTATDESLALGIRSNAKIIMSVPCCHKDLHQQQQRPQQQQQQRQQRRRGSSGSVDLFDPMMSHGILRQRMLDLLTDTFRAHLLRLMSYRTDVVEFVSGEHTPRNLLIRAVKQQQPLPQPESRRLADQYIQLKQYWGVTPHLEKLLVEDGLLPHALD